MKSLNVVGVYLKNCVYFLLKKSLKANKFYLFTCFMSCLQMFSMSAKFVKQKKNKQKKKTMQTW